MKNRYIDLFLILLVIFLFTGYFFIRDHTFHQPMISNIDQIQKLVMQEKWDHAEKLAKKIDHRWLQFKPWLLLNYGGEEFFTLTTTLNHIKGGITGKDKGLALANIKIFKEFWSNALKVVPEL